MLKKLLHKTRLVIVKIKKTRLFIVKIEKTRLFFMKIDKSGLLVAKIRKFKELFTNEKSDEFDNSIFYIGGSITLPHPLEQDKELECIELMCTQGCQDSRNLLIEHNIRLVVYIARKFDNTGLNIEDLISIGTIGLIKAVNTYKMEKNIKLATYASRCIENEILMYLRKNNKTRTEVSIDEPLNVDWEGNELLLSDILGTDVDIIGKDMEKSVEKNLLLDAISKLTKREQHIIALRFGIVSEDNELTQKEVADLLGISQSYISRLEKKIIGKLKKDINKLV